MAQVSLGPSLEGTRKTTRALGILTSGSPYSPRPSHPYGQWQSCGFRPQSQWRGRAGITPASLNINDATRIAAKRVRVNAFRCDLRLVLTPVRRELDYRIVGFQGLDFKASNGAIAKRLSLAAYPSQPWNELGRFAIPETRDAKPVTRCIPECRLPGADCRVPHFCLDTFRRLAILTQALSIPEHGR
jgi:hypothetical protein